MKRSKTASFLIGSLAGFVLLLLLSVVLILIF